ncbi:elongin C KNAG_0A02190 [Huiozyma naganishii CBS 8797]|uniref:Elongin-C n=1 Tax=Huiozyma naganishii (strain ATCC MYA-139 / BCRC 22969 / CBS 8797 / KCTC 17520 / NBRC 10181 / NCYC 3082 / Yp74L-3) TaxID=1071383 RepID=J7REC8_HUIN7|nr:hypothetical protein KNAG_0A02190 [Kazachstania naganishii CBS 8797]CCK67908.1 hypothetical protein KNAG_0A02190 [Kazachstania naganishii CBS 8797]
MEETEKNPVTLVASDGSEYTVPREAALLSPMLRAMLDGPFEDSGNIVTLPDIEPHVVAKVAEYLEYNFKYKEQAEQDQPFPEFNIPSEMSLELLIAADYLNI